MDEPRRRHRSTPKDPGQVGTAPGLLRRVRQAGGLLILSVAVRFIGFFALFVGMPWQMTPGVVILLISSVLFLATGGLSLSQPGRLRLARGPARWGGLCLAAAEVLAVVAALAFVFVSSSVAQKFMIQTIMPIHAGLLVGAAAGLLGHVRRLLRPGAPMRRSTTALLGMVIVLLLGWAVAIPLELGGLLLCMLPLPILATMVGLLMLTQRIPSRAAATSAIDQGLAGAGAIQVGHPQPEDDGVWWTAERGGRQLSVHLDDARLPLAVEITAHLDPVLSDLSLRRQLRKGEGVSTGDVMLDHLVTVEGISAERAAGLLSGQYGPVLSVLQGRPGSVVADGVVVLRASIGPGQDFIPRSAEAQCEALRELITEAVEDALALADALEERQRALTGELPAAGKLKREVLEDHP